MPRTSEDIMRYLYDVLGYKTGVVLDFYNDFNAQSLQGWCMTNPAGATFSNSYTQSGSSCTLAMDQFRNYQGYTMKLSTPATMSGQAIEIHNYRPKSPRAKKLLFGGEFSMTQHALSTMAFGIGDWIPSSADSPRVGIWRPITMVYRPSTGAVLYEAGTNNAFGLSPGSGNKQVATYLSMVSSSAYNIPNRFLLGHDLEKERYCEFQIRDWDAKIGNSYNPANLSIFDNPTRHKPVGLLECRDGLCEASIELALPTYPATMAAVYAGPNAIEFTGGGHNCSLASRMRFSDGATAPAPMMAPFNASSFNDATETWTVPTHTLSNYQEVRLSGATLPSGYTAGFYTVFGVTSTTFKLASSLTNAVAGTAVNGTTAGSGTMTFQPFYAALPDNTFLASPTQQLKFYKHIDLAREGVAFMASAAYTNAASIRVYGPLLTTAMRSALVGELVQFGFGSTTQYGISSVTDNSDGTYTVNLDTGLTQDYGVGTPVALGIINITGTSVSGSMERDPGSTDIFFPELWFAYVTED